MEKSSPPIDSATKELFVSCLKESKLLSHNSKYLEALLALERVTHLQSSKNLSFSLPLTKQISTLCNQIVLTVPAKVPYLRRAEQTLTSWLQTANSLKLPMNEKIFRIILLTYNNWATYHQSSKNYHMAMSYLMKGLRMIDESEIKEPDSFQYVAKTKLNVSALYKELRRYEDAIEFAEDCLASLQCELTMRLNGKDYRKFEGKERKKAEDMFNTYVIAFYNIGIAEELMNRKVNMQNAFRNAVNIGNTFLQPDNEVLVAAKAALAEISNFKPKSAYTSRNSIKISPEMLNDKLSATQKPKSTINIRSPVRRPSRSKDNRKGPDTHRPGRYYSEARLQKISQKIKDDDKLHFVSADQYFYHEISRLMNIGSDIRYLRPLTTSGAMTLWDRQTEEKRKISDLRLKKQHRMNFELPNGADLQAKINKLREIDEDDLKRQEIKMKSKMKTKVYKQLLRSICAKGSKYSFPPQSKFYIGLMFKPPIKETGRKTHNETASISSEVEKISKEQSEKRMQNVQSVKDEIENLMEKINGEIRHIDIETGVSKAPSPDLFLTNKVCFDNTLASSALKGKKNGKVKLRLFNTDIVVVKPKLVKQKTSPKVLLRSNTLIDLQD